MGDMGKFIKAITIIVFTVPLLGCESFSFDKQRAAEKRKQELCTEIDTRDQPYCASYGTGLQEDALDSLKQLQNPLPTSEDESK